MTAAQAYAQQLHAHADFLHAVAAAHRAHAAFLAIQDLDPADVEAHRDAAWRNDRAALDLRAEADRVWPAGS